MPTEDDDTIVTELESFEPTRVDGVGKGANGFPILMLKSIGDSIVEAESTLGEVLSDLDKAAEREDCTACGGSGEVVGAKKCGKCFGSGVQPMPGDTEKSLLDIAVLKESGVAASGQTVPTPHDCPTCKGDGKLPTSIDPERACPDCDGSGRDARYNVADTHDAFPGAIHDGDPAGREKIDKSVDLDEEDGDLEKAKLKTKARDALPDSAFALPASREYPIHDENHARAALSMLHNASPDEQAKIKAAVHRRYPDIGSDDAEKAVGTMFTAPNAQLAAMATKVGDDGAGSDDDLANGPGPGSPEWEGIDAATATEAAVALMAAAEKIREFAQREAIEVAAGEGNDIFDMFVAEDALCGVSHALGIMAQMAFHEGMAAKKGIDGVEKAGKRLSAQTKSALVELRTHLTNLLGDDDPVTATVDGASKAVAIDMAELAKELEDMNTDELSKLLDVRDEKLVSDIVGALKSDKDAKKGKSRKDQDAAVARAKAANVSGKSEGDDAVDEDDDLEDEAAQGNHDSASGTRNANGGAKAVLTDEEVAAKQARKEAKKVLKEARTNERIAAESAAIAKALKESTAEAEKAVDALKERLAIVEKMAAPSDVVRVRPAEALQASAERDVLEAHLARCEQMSKSSPDADVRREYAVRAKTARHELLTLTNSSEV